MNANVYAFHTVGISAHKTHDIAKLSTSDQIDRLEQLEGTLKNHMSYASLCPCLEEYLDIGLELANEAHQKRQLVLQESWLKRLFCFLRDTAFRQDCHPECRKQCLDYLYQPYFALRHIYQSDINGEQKMRRINKDLEVIARYVL